MEQKEFKRKVLPLRAKLLNYARKLTGNPDDAEDIVQEVLLKLWNNRAKLSQCHSIEGFAMTTTHHACMDWWRSQHSECREADCPGSTATDDTPEQQLEQKDLMLLIRQIVRSLPPLQRTIMQMKDIEGYETEEIAGITGCNAEAIRSNLSRARKRVREIYLKTIQQKERKGTP